MMILGISRGKRLKLRPRKSKQQNDSEKVRQQRDESRRMNVDAQLEERSKERERSVARQ